MSSLTENAKSSQQFGIVINCDNSKISYCQNTNMGTACSCETDESHASCPLGSVSIKHCGCMKKTEEKVQKTPEQLAEIKSRAEYQLWMAQQKKDGGDWPPKDKKED